MLATTAGERNSKLKYAGSSTPFQHVPRDLIVVSDGHQSGSAQEHNKTLGEPRKYELEDSWTDSQIPRQSLGRVGWRWQLSNTCTLWGTRSIKTPPSPRIQCWKSSILFLSAHPSTLTPGERVFLAMRGWWAKVLLNCHRQPCKKKWIQYQKTMLWMKNI